MTSETYGFWYLKMIGKAMKNLRMSTSFDGQKWWQTPVSDQYSGRFSFLSPHMWIITIHHGKPQWWSCQRWLESRLSCPKHKTKKSHILCSSLQFLTPWDKNKSVSSWEVWKMDLNEQNERHDAWSQMLFRTLSPAWKHGLQRCRILWKSSRT